MKLKVVLLEDIRGVGRKYEIKDLAAGYVQNFLLPRKMVELATPQILKKIVLDKEALKRKEADLYRELERLKAVDDFIFYLNVGANKEIYNSLTAKEIEEEIKKRGFPVAKTRLEKPIKELGDKEIEVSLGKNISGKIKISVQPLQK